MMKRDEPDRAWKRQWAMLRTDGSLVYFALPNSERCEGARTPLAPAVVATVVRRDSWWLGPACLRR